MSNEDIITDYQNLWNDLEKVAQKYGYEMGTLSNSEDTIDVMFVKKDDTKQEGEKKKKKTDK